MSQPTQYDMALMLESAGDFRQAFKIFKLLLCSDDHDRGDILFHCGWCLENDPSAENQCALPYYREAANTTANSVCRMNSLFRVGWLLMHEKNYHLAGMFFKEALAMHQCQQVHDGLYHEALYWYAVCL
ncbi:MAG: hypothetical protein GWN00_02375, partial [Aliifodinibius sp.]|nr:hypothetical protein [candidate division Zixibacteria bacterium]NIT55120.1 hypothetical protein [Fodinibius sp.]NIW43503.1 hypothetical protein [Gammaproteobacteria bacterium]NIS44657.1 hypothetical protein [candidate division Zixibacteria bacterium]NIU12714.1 hypothetical protein [candidate division Zixibacteria bacterium]